MHTHAKTALEHTQAWTHTCTHAHTHTHTHTRTHTHAHAHTHTTHTHISKLTVSVLKDDEGRLSSQFQGHSLQVAAACRLHDQLAHLVHKHKPADVHFIISACPPDAQTRKPADVHFITNPFSTHWPQITQLCGLCCAENNAAKLKYCEGFLPITAVTMQFLLLPWKKK